MNYKIPHYRVKLVKDGVKNYPVERVGSFGDAATVLHKQLDDLPHEAVVAIYLNGQNGILGTQTLAIGGLHGCALTPKDVFRGAFEVAASAIIIGHNHPSGNPAPSEDDLQLTKAVIAAGKILGIPLLDHVIVARGKQVSLRDRGCFQEAA